MGFLVANPISLKWKVWRIESALRGLLLAQSVKPLVWSFGAYYIDPKHLVFVLGVKTDEERDALKSNFAFLNESRELLVRFNWPTAARDKMHFDIESQETVDRETKGNWWYHYK